jgi:hypothetical protein
MKISLNSLRSTGFALALTVAACFAATAVAQDAPAAVPGVLPAFITAGIVDPNGKVPALNGVPGSGIANLDIAMPATILAHGTNYWYLVALQDTTFNGTCSITFSLTQVQGTKTVTLDHGTVKSSFSCGPASSWAWAASGKAVPNAPGLATLTGFVKYGTKTVATKTTVLIQ